jgi:hypothetical protein
MDFDLNTYSTQKVLYEEASSLDEGIEFHITLNFREIRSDLKKLNCDDLENLFNNN